jgi:hypothetical protein
MAAQYWSLWAWPPQICNMHKSLSAAVVAVKKCEKDGGAQHSIIKVDFIDRTKWSHLCTMEAAKRSTNSRVKQGPKRAHAKRTS